MAILAVAGLAAFGAGCGEEDFENEPRPPVTMELTGVIQEDKVTISPSRNIGAGPFEITVSNQTDAAYTLILEGQSMREQVGPVQPAGTATIRQTLAPGSYRVRAGTEKARLREIKPAVLDIGEERKNSNSELLLP